MSSLPKSGLWRMFCWSQCVETPAGNCSWRGFCAKADGDAVVLALVADHIARDNEAFVGACREGLVAADAARS
jgi:mannose-1-phosphate guanylyltransferase